MDEPLSITELMAKPILSIEEACIVIGLPQSTLDEILDTHPAPIFLLGRRKKIFTEDLKAWLREVAEANQWVARQNNRRR